MRTRPQSPKRSAGDRATQEGNRGTAEDSHLENHPFLPRIQLLLGARSC